ncbi:FecR family protein [Cellvibrio fontiphilus]|uniref:FecR family protein n=1 Tax=Cellvibrio fontiphilus TaxID=1815559 RepID=A0ABV7FCZ0_9GAMM
MSKIYQFQTENQIYDDASLWIARMDRGLSAEETEALRRWISASAKHKECLLEMAQLWDRMDKLSILSELFDSPSVAASTKRSLARPVWALAASALLAVVGLQLFMPQTPLTQPGTEQAPVLSQQTSQPSNTLYETGIGAHSTVNLPDGTRLLLNTNTQVSVTYSTDQRLLLLKKGELLVEVAHDKQRPLRVQVGDKIVEAVGTAFNVYLKDEQNFDVIVTEGRVKVKPIAQITQAITGPGTDSIQELGRGEKLSVRNTHAAAVEAIGATAIHDRLSWRDGNLVFRGETLQDALNELSRYTPDNFKVVDARINQVRIAGLYKAGDVEGLLLSLKENFNITSTRSADGVIELSMQQ